MSVRVVLRHLIRRIWDSPILPAFIAGVVYLITLAPGVYGYDSAELATGAYTLGIVHPTGYPLYLLLGKLFSFIPVGNIAFRVNLMSAVFATGTVAVIAQLGFAWIKNRLTANLAALMLAFAPSFWGMATVAEVYTLHTFLLSLNLLLAWKWHESGQLGWLLGLSLGFGLSLANHVTSLMFAPAYALICLSAGRWRRVIRFALPSVAVFSMALSLYLYIPLRDAAGVDLNYIETYYQIDLQSASGLWWMVSGQAYRFFAFAYAPLDYLRELGQVAVALWRNMTGLGLLLAAIGIYRSSKREPAIAAALAWVFASTILFFAGYAVADKLTMLLPAYLSLSLLAGFGMAAMLQWLRDREMMEQATQNLSLAVHVSVLAMIVMVAGANWTRADRSNALGAEAFARQTLSGVGSNALLISEWSPAVTLEYFQQVEGLRQDITIFNRSRYEVAVYYELWRQGVEHTEALQHIGQIETELIAELAQGRPIYGTNYDPRLANDYEYLPHGAVFEMVPRARADEMTTG